MPTFEHEPARGRPLRPTHEVQRPSFSSQKTTDRLRECERRPSVATSQKSEKEGKSKKTLRRSVFREEGLDDLNTSVHLDADEKEWEVVLGERKSDELDGEEREVGQRGKREQRGGNWYSKLAKARPNIKTSATAPPGSFSSIPRVALIAFLIAVVVPGFRYGGSDANGKVNISGADAGVIREAELVDNASTIEGRANSPTDVCTRWAHQIANVNGTVYIYGGQAKKSSGQTSDTWNNNFLTLDLTKTWNNTTPSLTGLPQPSGPPAVAMGALWHTYTSLYLYGGLFSDTPATSPLPVSTWEYDIKGSKWTEWASPQTSAGNGSDGGNKPVQRSAEGAGLSVPELGKSWYFGGHLDLYTTAGWSIQTARVYLRSLLEFTHPGYANTGVFSLGTTQAAPNGGVYRNITEGGLQDTSGFTERADGVLVYIPGWGAEGIILGLAGGTNQTFTEMNIIDVYDIANSTWYKQSTSGPSPPIRVNPCAAVAAAPDGSSFNIYLYGGQNLIPYGSQVQYSDMWILTIPSFTWIQVDVSGQSQPPARAGHSCTMWDGQLVVIGGYVGKDISCDSPGIYIFNASSLKWQTSFVALKAPGSDSGSGSGSGSGSKGTYNDQDSAIIQGSLGYLVPDIVQSVIGGNSMGGATATTPAAGSASAGPIATGRPPQFTITQSGSVVTQTAVPTSTNSNNNTEAKKSTNVGAITAGVIAGLLAVLAAYLAFCTWLYRRQVGLYRDHVAMAQRTAFNNSPDAWATESASGNPSGSGEGSGRMMEKVHTAPGVVLGPFGTEIAGSGSGSGSGTRMSLGGSGSEGRGGYGYGRFSEGEEGTEYLGAGAPMTNTSQPAGGHSRSSSWQRPGTGHSSMEDLLGNQEPSFFNVILNPRRTLRVVNSD